VLSNQELLNQGLLTQAQISQAEVDQTEASQAQVDKEEIIEVISSDAKLSCKLDTLAAGSSAIVRLSNFAATMDETVNAVVNSKTPDIDLTNNTTKAQDGQADIELDDKPLSSTPLPIQQDAVAQVSLAGMINPYWIFLLLLLNIRYGFRRSS
jgi:hypothetical protein